MRIHVCCFLQDIERLEKELVETAERLVDVEKLNHRQQKELESIADLQRKVGLFTVYIDIFTQTRKKATAM